MPERTAFISWEGAVSRGEFWKKYFALAALAFCTRIVAGLTASWLLAWLLWSGVTFIVGVIILLMIRRLRDVRYSPWFAVLLLAPILNMYVVYLLFIKKGTP